MKKSVFFAVIALVAVAGLQAMPAGGHRRHHGGRPHGWHGHGHHRHGRGWGGPGFGFGISVGSPGYYEPGPIAYIDDPYDYYWTRNPRASWDAYIRWLELNAGRFRRPWRYYYGRPYYRRWRSRPGVSFGVGFGF